MAEVDLPDFPWKREEVWKQLAEVAEGCARDQLTASGHDPSEEVIEEVLQRFRNAFATYWSSGLQDKGTLNAQQLETWKQGITSYMLDQFFKYEARIFVLESEIDRMKSGS